MILQRIGVVLLIALVVLFEAAIVAVMKDSSKKMPNPTKAFQKWLIIWAATNTTIIVVGWFIATGTILGAR